MHTPEHPEISTTGEPTRHDSALAESRLTPLQCFAARVGWHSGLLGALFSLWSSWQLATAHLRGLSLPGCGPDAGCTELTEGRWGQILGWPVSYIGLAWFSGLVIVWVQSRRRSPNVTLWLIRASLAGSVVCLALMFALGHLCEYCLRVHAGNLVLFLASEITSRRWPRQSPGQPTRGPVIGMTLAMLCVSAALAVWESQVTAQRQAAAARSANSVVREIVSPSSPVAASTGTSKLTGRWRLGPERSPVRVVVFGDYQCDDCGKLDQEIETLRQTFPQIHVTFRHFPMCRDCNVAIRHPRFHDNACVAARAAEAAGQLAQSAGFWRLHQWLFQHAGKFTEAELRAALPGLAFPDPEQFLRTMSLPSVNEALTEDVQLAISLGLDSTPLVFVNGVELPDADVPGTLTRTATELMELAVPSSDADGDRPRSLSERLVNRWRLESEVQFPESLNGWTEGDPSARIHLTLVYDYANPYTPLLDEVAREVVRKHPDVQLTRILFPLSKTLNPRFAKWDQDYYGPSTEMARLSQACALSGDAQAWRTIHQWLLDHQSEFELQQALAVARAGGLNSSELEQRLPSETVTTALQQRIQGLEATGIKWASTLYVNGRRVTAITPSVELLEQIVKEARSPTAAPAP